MAGSSRDGAPVSQLGVAFNGKGMVRRVYLRGCFFVGDACVTLGDGVRPVGGV